MIIHIRAFLRILRRRALPAGTVLLALSIFSGTAQSLPQNDARSVSLLSQIGVAAFGDTSATANDIYGYVSPSGREYAIVGLARGVGFVDVTSPEAPVIVGHVSNQPSLWGDMTTYGEHAYKLMDVIQPGSGIQVIDLREVDQGRITWVTSVFDEGLTTAHNIQTNDASGYLYACGANVHEGGLVAFDARDPSRPVFAGAWEEAYVHDVVVVTYTQGEYAGREIAFACCGSDGLAIIDVTDKTAMTTLAWGIYPNLSYCHQCWLSDDRRLLFIDDESDELTQEDVRTTTTYVMNVEDLEHPVFVRSFTNGSNAIDHNMGGRDGFLFQANYTSGLRIYDVQDLDDPREVGFYDTYPQNNSKLYAGAWGVYPYLPSGIVLVSDMQGGLFVFDVSEATARPEPPPPPAAARLTLEAASSNPFAGVTTLDFALPDAGRVRLQVVDARGRRVQVLADEVLSVGPHSRSWDARRSDQASGVYFAVLESGKQRRIERLVLVR